jgi:hypothetical protein
MLSRPREFAAFEGAGTTRSNQLLTARFLRTDLGDTRFGLATGRKLGDYLAGRPDVQVMQEV